MYSLLLLYLIFILSSRTYIAYIIFLLSMIHIVFLILLLGNYYLGIIYLMIYVGSIAILFIFILMVLSIVPNGRWGYILFILPFLTLSLFGITIYNNNEIYNILTLSYNIFSSLLIPIAILLFLAMIFAIRYI